MGTSAASSNATYEYIDLWSRSTTWGGGPPPVEGDSVWIQPGQRILYDVSSPRLYMLIIQGEFIFDRADLTLDANYIFVMGKGSAFVVGTEDEPFLHQALITLHGSPVSKEIPLYGAKVLACRECTLDLHGRPHLDGRVHTKLAATAEAGNATLVLTEPVDWPPNSMAFVSSTAANGTMEEAETVVVVGVEGGGTVPRLPDISLYLPYISPTSHYYLPVGPSPGAPPRGPPALPPPRRDVHGRRAAQPRLPRQRRAALAQRRRSRHHALLAGLP